jgi:aspartate-semialdehyde dehydrogenase
MNVNWKAPPRPARPFSVAVVGATGVVGRETLSILNERNFPIANLKALASERSAGERIEVGGNEVVVEALTPEAFQGVEVAFFCAGGGVSREFVPVAAEAGAVCIDKSSAYRMDPDVPLVVPEVNPDAIAGFSEKRIIASPNCTTSPLVQVLRPLHDAFGVKRVLVSSYQAVSGAGRPGIEELEGQVRALFNFKEFDTKVFGHRIAFNALPMIPASGDLHDDLFTGEEHKVIDETRKILGLPDLKVSATCVRVPVFNGHSEAVHIELDGPTSVEEARRILAEAPAVMVVDDPAEALYPTTLDAVGEDVTLVGRIRVDPAFDHGLALWLVSDNLRTGAALNAVRIAEHLCANHLS